MDENPQVEATAEEVAPVAEEDVEGHGIEIENEDSSLILDPNGVC